MAWLPGANTTNPSLIARVGDWQDHNAWSGFVRTYEPMIRSYCRRFAFDPDTSEDLMQSIWLEVARRLKTYSYDPGKTFRGWLIQVCRSRAIDLIRKRKLDAMLRLELTLEPGHEQREDLPQTEDDRPDFVKLAEAVQTVVRGRVDDRTWKTFWSIVVEGRPVRETAEDQGLSYAAAFAAQKRVRRMLRDEGQSFLLAQMPSPVEVDTFDKA